MRGFGCTTSSGVPFAEPLLANSRKSSTDALRFPIRFNRAIGRPLNSLEPPRIPDPSPERSQWPTAPPPPPSTSGICLPALWPPMGKEQGSVPYGTTGLGTPPRFSPKCKSLIGALMGRIRCPAQRPEKKQGVPGTPKIHLIPPSRAGANRRSSNVGFEKSERGCLQNSILSHSSRKLPRESPRARPESRPEAGDPRGGSGR